MRREPSHRGPLPFGVGAIVCGFFLADGLQTLVIAWQPHLAYFLQAALNYVITKLRPLVVVEISTKPPQMILYWNTSSALLELAVTLLLVWFIFGNSLTRPNAKASD